MNMTKPTLSLLFLALFSSSSIANEFKILDYHNGIKTDKLPCKMEAIDNWFTGDQYMCRFDNSATDVVEFQSDFISREVYQIDRYILIDISDARTLAKKIIKKNGYWNSGMFFARKDSIVNNFKKHQPQIFKLCTDAVNKSTIYKNAYYLNKHSFNKLKEKSFDYAILEKSKNFRF